MAKTFRSWDVDQIWLLPPSVKDLVPEGHLAHFVRNTVRETLDLSEILKEYTEERGYPPYHPVMMTALMLYAYCQGVYSSRRMAKACQERVDFMAVTARETPDFRTVSDFRKRHLKALGGLFIQVLKLCQKAGLVTLGHVALDGTKVKANASKHKAMSYGRMSKAEAELKAEIDRWFEKAEAIDREEDEEYGPDRRGDELPDWVANKETRLEKIGKAQAELEAEARAEGKEKPEEKAQKNFTDPESRIMKASGGFEQAYNAQAAVDAKHQTIVVI
jgi:transposase